MNLDQHRRELERREAGEPTFYICDKHGSHTTLVCVSCYAIQQERVERESIPLRYANTSQALRSRVIAATATRNGHSG